VWALVADELAQHNGMEPVMPRRDPSTNPPTVSERSQHVVSVDRRRLNADRAIDQFRGHLIPAMKPLRMISERPFPWFAPETS